MARPDLFIAKTIGNISLWSSRHAKAVVAVVLFMTLGLGYGVTLITTNVDVADVLPRGDPNTAAAHNLTDSFRSTFTQQVTFQLHVAGESSWQTNDGRLEWRTSESDPSPGTPGGYNNITDEVYIRAMQELAAFIEERTDFSRQVSINNIYALINWTIAGGEDTAPESSFRLPGYQSLEQAQQYTLVDEVTRAAVLDTVDALASPSWNHAALLFMPEADNDEDMRVLGQQVIDARDEYVEMVELCQSRPSSSDCELVWTVWGEENRPLLTVDLPVANAHSSELVEEDLLRLMPIIAAFIIVCLFIAFRNTRSILISFTALGVGVTWTYGTMGYMGIALNTLNMTIVPLIMGVGIDYSIHMINEFLEHKAAGETDAEAFAKAGGRAGLAMFIATLTTILGLVVMMVSPSLLMAQLGLLSAIAIGAIYVLTITFIPAALTLLGGTEGMGASFKPSTSMPALARGVTRTRVLMLLIVGILTFGAYVSSLALDEEAFGDPGKNFPKDDKIRQEHEQGLAYFYEIEDPDVKANILTFEGPGILTPEAIQYMRLIEENLATKELVIADTLRTLPFFIETWQTVKGGGPCALAVVAGDSGADEVYGLLDPILDPAGEGGAPCAEQTDFPETEAEIRAEVESMFASPMRELASIIINHPLNDMAAMTFSVEAATFEEAAEVWDQVWSAVDEANKAFGGEPPDGVHVAFVGNTATNFLFVAEQLPWLTYMSVAATIILFFLVLIFTLDLKATIVATGLAVITSVWWLGLLPFLGIGLAITLMLPLVFIFNIGTDYAVHLIWNLKKVGDAREVFATTGKAILFSAITTAGAFAIFTFIRNVAVSRTMVATTLSIFVIFTATMLVIPIFYKVLGKGGAPDEGPEDASDQVVKAKKRPKPTGS